MDWFHSVVQLRRAAHGIWAILATPFHLQRLQYSKVYSYSCDCKDLVFLSKGGRVKSSRSCRAAWLKHLDVVLLLQGFFQEQQGAQHCSICQPCGTSVLTNVARGQLARSPEPERIIKDSRGGRTTFADGVTMPPSLLEADAGLGLFRIFPAMLFVPVHLHLRMSAHSYWDAPRAHGMVSLRVSCRLYLCNCLPEVWGHQKQKLILSDGQWRKEGQFCF